MLNFAVRRKWLAEKPDIRQPRLRLFEKDLRTDDEICRFLVAARAEGEQLFVLSATALYTGMRARACGAPMG
jgi:hypothetical protein